MSSTMPYGWGRVAFDYESRLPWRNLPFPEQEYEQRIARLRELMAAEDLDGIVVVGVGDESANVRYLTNFQDFYGGETVVAIPADGEVVMITNAVMHGEPMHSGIQDAWPRDVRAAASPRTVTGDARPMTLEDHVKDALRTLPRGATIGTVGRTAPVLMDRLDADAMGWTTKPTALVGQLRSFKSEREIEVLRKACTTADAGLVAAMGAVAPGVTEFDVAAAANEAMFRAGAEHPAFAISVVAGPRSGLKHAAPTDYSIESGDIVYVDMGGKYMGYLSDSSRQTVCGDPSPEQLRMMETQIAIVETVSSQIKPGTVIGDMAAIATDMADAEGYADYLYFRGHGIGTGFDDRPALAPSSPHTWEEGMVFCLEPMLIRHGFGTACWEDVWHVTSDGCVRLNEAPYRFWSIS